MSDVNITVGGNFEPLIRNARSTAQEIRRVLADIERQAVTASGAGRATGAVGAGVSEALSETRRQISAAAITQSLSPERQAQRLRTFDQAVERTFGRFEGLVQRARALEGQLVESGRLQQVPPLRELNTLAEFIRTSRELQRATPAAGRLPESIYDRHGFRAGLQREQGLLFGIAEEEEFRARDRRQGAPGGLFGFGDPREMLREIGIDPESDLGLRTIKDVLRRERESREEIVDLNQRIVNEGEREQRAFEDAMRRLRNALQERANREAAATLETPEGRSLLGLEAENQAQKDLATALQQQATIAARQTAGVGEQEAAAAAARRVETQAIRLATTRRLAQSADYVQTQAATIVAERNLQRAINQEAQRIYDVEGPRGTGFQRVQAAIARRSGGAPRPETDYQQFGQFLQARFLTTAGFAVSGFATYALQAQIREIIREATELQTELGIIEGVLASIGDTGGAAFERVREGVLQVARDTATSADVVARVQRQLAGIFADPETLEPNFDRARVESESAFRLARITGLPEAEITDSLAALSVAFGRSFEEIGNHLLGYSRQLGASETETMRFVADLAPLASELGISLEQITAIGSAALAATGQAGGALAEQIRRILPGLQERATEVVDVFAGAGEQAQRELGEAFGGNDLGRVLNILLRDYDQLSKAQQNQLASLVGGRREAGAFFAVLSRGDPILRALGQSTGGFAGELDRRFENVSGTVKFAFDEMERAVEEFGIKLFESGAADALVNLAEAGSLAADVLGVLLDVFSELNDLTGGLPARILGMAAAIAVLQKAARFGAGIFGEMRGPGAAAPTVPFAPAGQVLPGVAPIPPGPTSPYQRPTGLRRVFSSGAMRVLAAGVIATEVLAVKSTLDEVRAAAAEQRQELSDRVTEALNDRRTFDEVVSDVDPNAYDSLYDKVSNLASGQGFRSTGAAVIDEAQRTYFERYKDALRALSDSGNLRANELLTVAILFGTNNDKLNADLQEFVAQERRRGTEEIVAVDEAGDVAAAAQEAIDSANQRSLTFEEAVADYEAGIGSQVEVLEAFRNNLAALNDMLAGALREGEDTTDIERQIAEEERRAQQFLAESINDRFDLALRSAQAFGGRAETPEFELQQAQARLTSLQAAGASPDAITDAAFRVLEAQRAILDARMEETEDVFERDRIGREGIVADVNARMAVIEANVAVVAGLEGNREILELIARLGSARTRMLEAAIAELEAQTGEGRGLTYTPAGDEELYAQIGELQTQLEEGGGDSDFELLVDQIVDSYARLGRIESDVLDTAIADIRRRITKARDAAARAFRAGTIGRAFAALGEAARLNEQLNEVLGIVGEIERIAAETTDETITAVADSATGPEPDEGLPRRIAEARIAVERARANNDPVALARLARQSAQIQIDFAKDEAERLQGVAAMIEADNQLADAIAEIADSYRELEAAATEDPLADALLALATAQSAVTRAVGTAERNRAIAQQYENERSLRDAIRGVIDSELELVAAVAEAGGDDLSATMARRDQARAALDRQIYERAGPEAINRARANIVRADAAVRDARLQTEQEALQFQRDMGQITTRQYIDGLRALMQIPGLNQDQLNQLALEIRRLTEDMGREFQFNLPDQLVPTIYEAQRLANTGGNYQQTRIGNTTTISGGINVEVNAQTNADPNEIGDIAAAKILEVVGDPTRTGTFLPVFP